MKLLGVGVGVGVKVEIEFEGDVDVDVDVGESIEWIIVRDLYEGEGVVAR